MAATYHPQVQPPTTPAAPTTPATATTPSPSAASSPGGAGSQEAGNGQAAAEQENGVGSHHHHHNNNHLNSHSVHAAHSGHSSYVMNLVNSSQAAINAAAAAASAQCYGAAASPVPRPHEMHEMKYLPPQSAAHAAAAGLHNGHHHPALHNPWGIPSFDAAAAQAHWAMHPAAAAHSLYSQDLKQDIKPDFNNRAPVAPGVPVPPPHHMAPHSGWNPPAPPPVSSPYLGATSTLTTSSSGPVQPAAAAAAAAAVAATPPTSGTTPVPPGHSSPSPLQHHWNGMMPPGVVPPGVHPSAFVDRYGSHRDSHNSSPGSVEGAGSGRGHPEDGMLTPTSGTSHGHPGPPSLHPADEPFGNELFDCHIFTLSLSLSLSQYVARSLSRINPGRGARQDDTSLTFALWAFHFRRGLPPGMA